MSPEDEQQQKIEAIQARLAKQERRTTCLTALLISLALASLGFVCPRRRRSMTGAQSRTSLADCFWGSAGDFISGLSFTRQTKWG